MEQQHDEAAQRAQYEAEWAAANAGAHAGAGAQEAEEADAGWYNYDEPSMLYDGGAEAAAAVDVDEQAQHAYDGPYDMAVVSEEIRDHEEEEAPAYDDLSAAAAAGDFHAAPSHEPPSHSASEEHWQLSSVNDTIPAHVDSDAAVASDAASQERWHLTHAVHSDPAPESLPSITPPIATTALPAPQSYALPYNRTAAYLLAAHRSRLPPPSAANSSPPSAAPSSALPSSVLDAIDARYEAAQAALRQMVQEKERLNVLEARARMPPASAASSSHFAPTASGELSCNVPPTVFSPPLPLVANRAAGEETVCVQVPMHNGRAMQLFPPGASNLAGNEASATMSDSTEMSHAASLDAQPTPLPPSNAVSAVSATGVALLPIPWSSRPASSPVHTTPLDLIYFRKLAGAPTASSIPPNPLASPSRAPPPAAFAHCTAPATASLSDRIPATLPRANGVHEQPTTRRADMRPACSSPDEAAHAQAANPLRDALRALASSPEFRPPGALSLHARGQGDSVHANGAAVPPVSLHAAFEHAAAQSVGPGGSGSGRGEGEQSSAAAAQSDHERDRPALLSMSQLMTPAPVPPSNSAASPAPGPAPASSPLSSSAAPPVSAHAATAAPAPSPVAAGLAALHARLHGVTHTLGQMQSALADTRAQLARQRAQAIQAMEQSAEELESGVKSESESCTESVDALRAYTSSVLSSWQLAHADPWLTRLSELEARAEQMAERVRQAEAAEEQALQERAANFSERLAQVTQGLAALRASVAPQSGAAVKGAVVDESHARVLLKLSNCERNMAALLERKRKETREIESDLPQRVQQLTQQRLESLRSQEDSIVSTILSFRQSMASEARERHAADLHLANALHQCNFSMQRAMDIAARAAAAAADYSY